MSWLALALLLSSVSATGDETAVSKKAAWLSEKSERQPVHREKLPPALAAHPAITFNNVWTDEHAPVVDGKLPLPNTFDLLLRCHYTQQSTHMAPKLYDIVLAAAHHFNATSVQLVSGYRAPKYQLTLRKKGHEVARDSEHPRGEAVDFRLPGVPTKQLYRFVRTLRAGGVGIYPVSQFVHADVGRIRVWRGH